MYTDTCMKSGTVYWITGLAGAGKTTIGTLLYNKLREDKPNVIMLDGDIARWAYNDTAGYSAKDREAAAYRNARVCKMISDQGVDVVCCTVSMFEEVRIWNRNHIKQYREIFLDVPMEVLKRRDQKGLYSKLACGEEKDVVGMDLVLEVPSCPDVRIENDGSHSPLEVLSLIWDAIMQKEIKYQMGASKYD